VKYVGAIDFWWMTMPEKKTELKRQYPDVGAGIATGTPSVQVVGSQAIGAGKKPYPVNPTPMQGPGDNPSVQPVVPKLQSWTPDPKQTEEGIDQHRLLTDPEYANLVTGFKLKEPAASRVLNEEAEGSWVTLDEGRHVFTGNVTDDNKREALYTTVPNGLQEETENSLQQMFDKERTEHPDFTDDQIWQIVADHVNKAVAQRGSTIYLNPSFDGDHQDFIRNIGEHWDMVDQKLKSAGFIEKQRIAGVSRYSHPMTGSMAEVKATDNSGLLHVVFSDRIGQVIGDVSTFSGLNDFLQVWYQPKTQYSRSLKPLASKDFGSCGLLCGLCDTVMHDGSLGLVPNYAIVPVMGNSAGLIVCEKCAENIGEGIWDLVKDLRFGVVLKDLNGKYRSFEK
jgi:hypothetical protein